MVYLIGKRENKRIDAVEVMGKHAEWSLKRAQFEFVSVKSELYGIDASQELILYNIID